MERILLLLILLTAGMGKVIPYKAAVVEFSPDLTDERVEKNLKGFESALESIKNEGVQIIVFPEAGISGPLGLTVFEQIPDPVVNPCEENGFEDLPIIKRLSCLASHYGVVLIANLGDEQGSYKYNTNVVFESDGRLIAKYHKINLYGGERDIFMPGARTSSASFKTNFGVEFGMFVCFDILFPQPSVFQVELGIENFIYSTAWGNKFPTLMSTAVQQGWSGMHNANLLAANLHIRMPEYKHYGTGSGIYSAGIARRYFMAGDGMSAGTGEVLVAELTSNPAYLIDNTQYGTITGMDNIQTKNTSKKEMTFSELTGVNGFTEASHLEKSLSLYCSLEYKIKGGINLGKERYALGAHINHVTHNAACIVVKCVDSNSCGQLIKGAETTFEYLRLNGNLSESSKRFSTALSDDFKLLNPIQLNERGAMITNSKITAFALNFIIVPQSNFCTELSSQEPKGNPGHFLSLLINYTDSIFIFVQYFHLVVKLLHTIIIKTGQSKQQQD